MRPEMLLAGKYRLQVRVGAGGMGEVWRATHEVLGRVVAVKVMKPELLQEPAALRRFRAEARAMATVDHHGVVAIYDFDDASDALLVMEYIDGESLAVTLRRQRHLHPIRTMELVAQAADALSAAHRRGMVHRDVKPSNLLVRRSGAVVLTDFGIVRIWEATPSTADGKMLGTPSYLAPEQVRGQPAEPRSDVYALGVLAYECLTGSRPFDRDNPWTTAMARLNDLPPPLPNDVPPAVAAVVTRALAREPADRWPTAADMAAACRRAAMPPPSAPTDSAPLAQRSPKHAAAPQPSTLSPGSAGAAPAAGPGVRRLRPAVSTLASVLLVALVAAIAIPRTVGELASQINAANDADQTRIVAIVSERAGELVHHLQDERAAAVRLLASDLGNEEQVSDRTTAYTEIQAGVDEAGRQFETQSAALADLPFGHPELLAEVHSGISILPQTRTRVSNGELPITDTTGTYTEIIGGLLSLRELSAKLTADAADTPLSNRMQAAIEFSRAKEFLSQVRVIGHEVLYRGAYHPHLRNAFIGAQVGHDLALEAYSVLATTDEQAALDSILAMPDVRQSRLYQGHLDNLDSGSLSALPWDAAAWDAAMSAHANLIWEAEQDLDGAVVDGTTAMRAAAEQQVLVDSGELLVMLLAAILLALLAARSMVRSLRHLPPSRHQPVRSQTSQEPKKPVPSGVGGRSP